MRRLIAAYTVRCADARARCFVRCADVSCSMTFQMKGWSVFYKTASGTGTIRCSNGQTAAVKLEAKGGGLTFGKSSIENGKGEFSGVQASMKSSVPMSTPKRMPAQ